MFNSKSVYSIVFLIVVLFSAPAFTSESIIRPDHPRIYVTTDTIDEVRRLCREEYKSLYDDLLSTNWILNQTPGVDYTHMSNMIMPAFRYLIEGDPSMAAKTKAYLDALADNPPRDQYLTPEYIRQAAACYDWIHDRLTPEEKERYAAVLVEMSDYVLSLWRHSDFNNHFVNETVSVLFTGLALDGDGVDDENAKRLLDTGSAYLKDHAIPAANEIAGEDGGQAEGFSYNDWGYARPLAYLTEAWYTATGENLYENSSYFKTQSLWHLYCLRPHDQTLERPEDCPSGLDLGENLKTFIHLFAARCGDGYGQWLGDQIEWRYKQNAWKEILWRDPQLKPKSPADLPLARHFRKLGWVATRSGWNDPNAAFALFQCGDFYAGHQHVDANTFVIHKSGSLAIDSGVNEYSSHRANYYCRTIAHNGITVFDPSEEFTSAVWSGSGSGGSNDGGQLRGNILSRVGTFEKGGPSDVGDITDFFANERITYVCGDVARAYSSTKMEWFTRQFVHIQPDLFVVFDRVVSKQASFKKTWLLHSIPRPLIDGRHFTIEHDGGRLDGHVVLPLEASVQSIGGAGKEYWVNGTNYPPDSKTDPEAGAWRIEVSPMNPNRSDVFLHVLQTSLAQEYEPAQITPLEENGLTGASIQQNDLLAKILFSTEETPMCRIQLTKGNSLIEDLTLGEKSASVKKVNMH